MGEELVDEGVNVKKRFGLVMVVILALAGTVIPTTLAAQQAVTVGQTSVGWTGNWQYDPSSSMDSQATLAQVDATSGTIKLATYGEFWDDSVYSPSDALETFASSFFEGAGATAVAEQDAGTLDTGAVWKIYTFDLQGLELSFLATVSETASGAFIVSTLTGNTDQFSATIEEAQREITLNGQLVFLQGVESSIAGSSHIESNAQPAVTSTAMSSEGATSSEVVRNEFGSVNVAWNRDWSKTEVGGQQFSLTNGTAIVSVTVASTNGANAFSLHDAVFELVHQSTPGATRPVSVVGGDGFVVMKATADGHMFGQEYILQGNIAIVMTFIVPSGGEATLVQSANGGITVNGLEPFPSLEIWVNN